MLKKSVQDRFSDVVMFFLHRTRPAIEAWLWMVAQWEVIKDPRVDFTRRKPYLLLANHTFDLDVVHVPRPFWTTPHIVASNDLFVHRFARFAFNWIFRCIPTSKGKGDVGTVKTLINTVRKRYPVLVFPEGDLTFFGATGRIDPGIAVLAKKLGIDVITCRVSGGHLSAPRWAIAKRKNPKIELRYNLALTAREVAQNSPRWILERIEEELRNNDFEYQRAAMVPHPSKRAAEGLQDVLYACPDCGAFHSIRASGNELSCAECGVRGSVDEYGFLRGFRFDDTVTWDRFQRELSEGLRATIFTSPGRLVAHDYRKFRERRIGDVAATYRAGRLELRGALNRDLALEELDNVFLTGRTDLNFTNNGTTYVLRLERKAVAFLRACQDRY
jgi:1-acyl-sn-glycerol-3-phosphate acyltransferase